MSEEQDIPECPECGAFKVEKLKSKYSTNYLCHNSDCRIVAFPEKSF